MHKDLQQRLNDRWRNAVAILIPLAPQMPPDIVKSLCDNLRPPEEDAPPHEEPLRQDEAPAVDVTPPPPDPKPGDKPPATAQRNMRR